jgi:hypothetical protein
MRLLALFLILANLAFFAWWRYLAPQDEGTEPARMAQQIAPEALRVVPAAAAGPAAQASCREWGGFGTPELARAQQAIAGLALAAAPAAREITETRSWWVYIPPGGGREAALKRAADLKTLGITDFFVVQDEGPNRWAVSLGIFRSEELARARLEALRGKRVRTAQLGTREAHFTRTWLQASGLTAAQLEQLAALARQFEGSEVRPCS